VDNPNFTPKPKPEFREKYDPEPLSGGLPGTAKVVVRTAMSRQGTICRPFPPHSPPRAPINPQRKRTGFGMPDATAERNRTMSQTAERHEISGSNGQARPALDARYGQIGISAVAAAARYQGVAKNPAYAPAPNDWRLQYAEELA
jgi:hypothetical protein